MKFMKPSLPTFNGEPCTVEVNITTDPRIEFEELILDPPPNLKVRTELIGNREDGSRLFHLITEQVYPHPPITVFSEPPKGTLECLHNFPDIWL